jgi:hypothetical protein
MRRVGVVVSVLLTVSLLSGCSAKVGGWAGVTIDAQGAVQIVVQACDLPFDWLSLSGSSIGDAAQSPPTYSDEVRWDADPAVEPGTFTQVPAIGSTAPWSLRTAAPVFVDGMSYSVWAGMDSMWGGANRSSYPMFTSADLAKLRPGQVLAPLGEVMTLEQFRSGACS